MAGYKRVNFYELCRLCATNQQKEKTHIFEEEGRKIQLQSKIQSCLALKVCEDDCLPKVVCGQCLRSLEDSYLFKNECANSELMLSSYFNNFRYTEDFKKSGKVYIKDTTCSKAVMTVEQPVVAPMQSPPVITQPNIPPTTPTQTQPKPVLQPAPPPQQQHHPDPLYFVPLPTQEKLPKTETPPKINQSPPQHQISQNYNVINPVNSHIKCIVKQDQTTVNNITVNSHGEIINLGSISDIEALIAQNMVQKLKHSKPQMISSTKRTKYVQEKAQENNIMLDSSVIHIDLTSSEVNPNTFDAHNIKFEKLPHIKTTSDNKFMYTIKIEDSKQSYNNNQGIVLSQINNIPHQSYQPFQTTTIANNIATSTIPNVSYSNVTQTVSNNNQVNSTTMPQKIDMSPPKMDTNVMTTNVMQSHITEAYLPEPKPMLVVSQPSTVVRSSNVMSNQAPVSSSNLPVPTTVNMSNFMNLAYCNHNVVNSTTTSIPVNNNPEEVQDSLAPDLNQPIQQPSQSSSVVGSSGIPQPSTNGTSRVHICEVCQKIFKRREHLNQHLKLHTGYRPFVCESCNKSFMRKEHLLRHMTSHSGQKNYTCNICDKSFSRNDNLLKHKKTHEKQGKYTCEYCQKCFVMKHYYLAHKMTHEPEQKCVWNVVKV